MGTVPPRVSVLLPVHNCADHVRASIDSVLNQEYQDFEVVVIDDGSTDSGSEIIGSYSDSRVKVVRNESNIGLPCSLNRGFEKATGCYIARQDADDVSMSDRLRLQVELMDCNSEIGISGTWWEWMDVDGMTYAVSKPDPSSDAIRSILLEGRVPVPHGTMMLRRETFEDLGGYDDRFWFSQDFDLWLRLMDTQWQIGIVEKPLYKLRISPTYTPFKELCQRRYTEIALEQHAARQRLEFKDVREQVRAASPEIQNRVPQVEANYWSELGNAALSSLGDRSVARMYFMRGLRLGKSTTAFVGLLLTFTPRWFAKMGIRAWRLSKRLL